jgi:hyperosmotically inducible periplasmic protein
MYNANSKLFLTIMLMMSFIVTGALAGCASDSTGRSMGTTVDDSVITSKVKSSLLADDVISGFDINVETNQGNVMLSGFVDNKNQIDRAVTLTKKIQGVERVVNHLEVKPEAKASR